MDIHYHRWTPKSQQMVTAAMKLKDAGSLEEKLWPTRQHIQKQRHYFANKRPSSQSNAFSSSHVRMWELDHKETWAWRIDAFELWCWRRLLRVSWTAWWSNQSILWKSFQNTHWIDWCWSWNSNTLATWCKELTHWERPWWWARLKAGGEGDDRGWNGWKASQTGWTWVWVSSGSWWWTGKPGVLQCMGLQTVGHDRATELTDWTYMEAVNYRRVHGYLLLHDTL